MNIYLYYLDSSKVLFYAAVYVRNILADQLHLAETDLLDAAADKPMYGALHIIRCSAYYY